MNYSDISTAELKMILEAILKIRGGRGYSAGHPYKEKTFTPPLGKSEYEYPEEHDEASIPDEVEISKAFKGLEK